MPAHVPAGGAGKSAAGTASCSTMSRYRGNNRKNEDPYLKLTLSRQAASTDRALKNLPLLAFLCSILAYGGLLAWHMLANFDLVSLVRDMLLDDSFYYFQIARNLAEGKFSTFDGGITRTNGYHPVWMFLITPFYWIFDPETALFGIKAFECLLIAGAVVLIVLAARAAHSPWILLFAALPTLYGHQSLIMGMEAAAALFMLGLLFLVMILFVRNPARWKWPLTATVFMLPWVRLEYIAISLVATAALCLVEWSKRRESSLPSNASAYSVSSLEAAILFSGACAGILAYFVYNGLIFGGIVPVSGAAKLLWSQQAWEADGYVFLKNFQEVVKRLPDGPAMLRTALEACIYAPLVWWFDRRFRGPGHADRLFLVFLIGVFSLGAGHLAQFMQIVFRYHADFVPHSKWYYVPAYLLMALIVPVRCYVAVYFVRRLVVPKSSNMANVASVCILVTGVTFMALKTDFVHPFRSIDEDGNSTHLEDSWNMAAYEAIQVANRILPEGSIIGAWDAGVASYLSRFPVVNLDGLVNSYDYLHLEYNLKFSPDLHHSLFGTTHYIVPMDIDRISDRQSILFEGRSFVPSGNTSKAYRIWTPASPWTATEEIDPLFPGALLWQRMKPYFHYESNGTAAIAIHRRFMQLLSRDCDPPHVPEMVVFSWKAGDLPANTIRLWPQPERNHLGYCSQAFILPVSVNPPIRIETTTVDEYLNDALLIARSVRDVYFKENKLLYVEDPCTSTYMNWRIFVHVTPVDQDDLPYYRMMDGFDDLDFRFYGHDGKSGRIHDRCIAVVELPGYDVKSIKTGQYGHEDSVWEYSLPVAVPTSSKDREH